MKLGILWTIVGALTLSLGGWSQANFTISMQQDVSITANGTATMDVYIEGAGHELGSFQYVLEISGPQNLGILQFRSEQPNPEFLTGANGETYVFAGDSFWLSAFPIPQDQSTISATDTLQVGDPIEFGANSKFLLARLEFEHLGEVAADGYFTVSLNTAESIFDSDFDPETDNNISAGPASTQIKIVATPEPATVGVLGVLCVATARYMRRRKRRNPDGTSCSSLANERENRG